jgi:hypothetical protein
MPLHAHIVRLQTLNFDVVHVHCKENPIYVFLFWELRGLSPNFHIDVSVSDLYTPRIGPHISLKQNGQTYPGNANINL